MVNYWGVRLGEGGRYVQEGYSKNFIGIGWEELGDLTWLLELKSDEIAFNKLKAAYKSVYAQNVSPISIGLGCGQILRFIRAIRKDDIILVPNPSDRIVIVGRIDGGYTWKNNWGDACPYTNRRKITWVKTVPRQELSNKLKNSLVWLTVISLEDHATEVESLLSETYKKPKGQVIQVSGQELRDNLIERLRNLSAREFEEFIAHLLGIIGFDSANRQHIGDRGIDIDGVLSTELGSINLKVQVKGISGTLGNKEVLQLRGALATDEHGVIVSTGTFSKPAREEAEAQGKKLIKLVDREDLVDIILTNYNGLDGQYKKLLNLEKKEIPLSEQFFMPITQE